MGFGGFRLSTDGFHNAGIEAGLKMASGQGFWSVSVITEDASPVLKCESINHSFEGGYSPLQVIDDVSFILKEGETISVVGPSGCGKTTLLRICLNILKPTLGSVIVRSDLQEAPGSLGYLPQVPALLPWRTVLQNAILGLELLKPIDTDDILLAKDTLAEFGLLEFQDEVVDRLSGGMKQKLALACVLLRRPSVLFCDEPFSSIDFVGRLNTLTQFRTHHLSGVSCIFVTHNIEEAIYLGDRVLILSRRPARIVKMITRRDLQLAKDWSAVEVREDPRFTERFKEIWSLLSC